MSTKQQAKLTLPNGNYIIPLQGDKE